ncbi:MAG: hypothetical protein LUQ54_04750 [Methanoregula sp.]|nr:hypothetical protein [Methanoregula sp.]
MVKDITKTINELRCTAAMRCRERLEEAAQKAKEIFKNGKIEDKEEKAPPCKEQYGVTSLLKRKHGL